MNHPNYGKGVKVNLPVKLGDTYAIPLAAGSYGIARVVNSSSSRSEKFQTFLGFSAPLVVATNRTFPSLPKIAEIDPEKNLYLNNLMGHSESTDPKAYLIKFYVHSVPPPEFKYLGNIAPSGAEIDLVATGIGEWPSLSNQWRRGK